MKAGRALAGLATLVAVAGLEGAAAGLAVSGEGADPVARTALADVPEGGLNLRWCLLGVSLASTRIDGVELAGAVLMSLNCR